MMHRRTFIPLVVLGATGLTSTTALDLPAVAADAQPRPVDVEVVTEVLPTAYAATAVVVEYDRPITVSDATPASSFEVTATLQKADGVSTGKRTVTRVYSNDEPARQAHAQRGRFLVVELATTDPNAAVSYWDSDGITRLSPLAGAFTLTQTAPVTAGAGVSLPVPEKPMANTGHLTPVIDEFSAERFTSTGGTTLSYRLFVPEPARSAHGTQPARYPLAIALHGFGERGGENLSQVVGNQLAYAFAQPSRQRTDPAFVIAPQAPTALPPEFFIWNPDSLHRWILELVADAIHRYPVDPDRVYLTGLSMGAIGSYALLPKADGVFAGALLATGLGDPAQADTLAKIPLWAVHSIDDDTVHYDDPTSDKAVVDAIAATGTPVVYGEWPANLPDAEAEARARSLWNQARSAGSHTLFTTFSAGTTPGGPHSSWVPMYLNDVQLDWLYSQRR